MGETQKYLVLPGEAHQSVGFTGRSPKQTNKNTPRYFAIRPRAQRRRPQSSTLAWQERQHEPRTSNPAQYCTPAARGRTHELVGVFAAAKHPSVIRCACVSVGSWDAHLGREVEQMKEARKGMLSEDAEEMRARQVQARTMVAPQGQLDVPSISFLEWRTRFPQTLIKGLRWKRFDS